MPESAPFACDHPPLYPGSDNRQVTASARIEGTVVVNTAARGNVELFLYDAARPPPPTGTGRPKSFLVLEQATVFGNAVPGDVGPFTAPFAFSLVLPGTYLVRGFVDANSDFIPSFAVTSEPNQGDVGGSAIDASRNPRTVEVTADALGMPQAAVDVRVAFSDALKLPVDRPAFAVTPSTATLGPTGTTLELSVLPLSPASDPFILEPNPIFLARLVDTNGDGTPDDFWPHVVVRKLSAQSLLADENDLDKNGILDTDAGFADYEHVDPMTGEIPADGAPDLVVLAAAFDHNIAGLLSADGGVRSDPLPVPKLTLHISPRALDVSDAAQGRLPGNRPCRADAADET